MTWKHFLPLIGFALLTAGVGFGVVSPRSSIAGFNVLALGFASTVVGMCVTYVLGQRQALPRTGGIPARKSSSDVTRSEFRPHPDGHDVLSGLIVYPISAAKSVLQQYREFAAKAPDDLSVWVVLRQAPPLPFLPPSAHGKGMVALVFRYTGDALQGVALIDPLRRFGTPIGEHVGVRPHTAWQQAFDPVLTSGARNHWKSHNLSTLGDGVIEVVVDYVDQMPSAECEICLAAPVGGTTRTAESTAYPREAHFVMNTHGRWDAPAADERSNDWARDVFGASAPCAATILR